MPAFEAPPLEVASSPQSPSIRLSPVPSDISDASSPEPQNVRPTPLFRALAMPPPEPDQPRGQDELERRLPGYRRIVIPRELTLIELLKQSSGANTDEEVLRIREAKLRVIAEQVGLRRLHVLAPRLKALTLDGSALSSLRDLGIGLSHLKILSVNRCGLTTLDGVWGLGTLQEFYAAGNKLQDLQPLAALQKLHTLNLADNPLEEADRLWTLGVCNTLRYLTLKGTPLSDDPDYRITVACALPMLVALDDLSLLDEDLLDAIEEDPCSDHEDELLNSSGHEKDSDALQNKTLTEELGEIDVVTEPIVSNMSGATRRRPATTDGAGQRPPRVALRSRPVTAYDGPMIASQTRLEIVNTLMDNEWRCSGSKLTSVDPCCGNLARALRRPSSASRRPFGSVEKALVEETTRRLSAEIPGMAGFEDWTDFKKEIGIYMDVDFNKKPTGTDPMTAIERLDKIEQETRARLRSKGLADTDTRPHCSKYDNEFNECNIWSDLDLPKPSVLPPISNYEDFYFDDDGSVDYLAEDIRSNDSSLPD